MPAARATAQESPSSPDATLLAALLLVLLIALTYSHTLHVPILFDDEPSIEKNESIRHFSTAFSPPKGGEPVTSRPLLNATFALNYAFSGLSLPALHVTNILIHALAALTLFGVVRRTLGLPVLRGKFAATATQLAWFAAALWALHPLQTESVTYLSQRAESLVGLFYLLALYTFIRANETAAPRHWVWLVWIVCLAGMATKEVMATFPLVALLYERIFLRSTFRECWRCHARLYLALASTWLLLGWLVASGGGRGNTVGFAGNVTWWDYLCTQSYAIVRYLFLAIWPSSLTFDYGPFVVKSPATIVLCSTFVVALLAATALGLKRRPLVSFLGAWFFLILAPTTSVIPVITQTMAEHRMYLPLAALTTGTALLLWSCPGKVRHTLLAGLVLTFGFVAWQRNQTYRTATGLWEDTIAKRPENPRALNILGWIYVKQRRFDEGIATLRKVLCFDHSMTETNYNLGYALARLGRDEEAIQYYKAALDAKADNLDALANYGAALLRLGRIEESITNNRAALSLDPKLAEPNNNLGIALLRTGQTEAGLSHLRNAVSLQPTNSTFARQLVTALIEHEQREEAIGVCETFLRHVPSVDFYTLLGVLHAQNHQLKEARNAFISALRLDPANVEATQNLARANALLERSQPRQ